MIVYFSNKAADQYSNKIFSLNQIPKKLPYTFLLVALDFSDTVIVNTLLSFAKKLKPSTSVSLNYCKKLAWTGTSDSKGYKNLSNYEKDDIQDIISGERGSNPNQSNFNQIGKSCP